MYTDSITGESINTEEFEYRNIILSVNKTLLWPYQTRIKDDCIAKLMVVSPQSAGLTLTLPSSHLYETGFYCTIRNDSENTLRIKSSDNLDFNLVSNQYACLFIKSNSKSLSDWLVFKQGTLETLNIESEDDNLIIENTGSTVNNNIDFSFGGIIEQFSEGIFNLKNSLSNGFYFLDNSNDKAFDLTMFASGASFGGALRENNLVLLPKYSSNSSNYLTKIDIAGQLSIFKDDVDINNSPLPPKFASVTELSSFEDDDYKILIKNSNFYFNADYFVFLIERTYTDVLDYSCFVAPKLNSSFDLFLPRSLTSSSTGSYIVSSATNGEISVTDIKTSINVSEATSGSSNKIILRPSYVKYSRSVMNFWIIFDGKNERMISYYYDDKVLLEDVFLRVGVGVYRIDFINSTNSKYNIQVSASDSSTKSAILCDATIGSSSFTLKCLNRATGQYQDCDYCFVAINYLS